MKGKIARIAALTLAVLLALSYGLLPGVEERSVPSGGGRGKYTLEDGESASWPWTPDMAATDLQAAQNALSEITGDRADEKLLDRVFSKFCVGK